VVPVQGPALVAGRAVAGVPAQALVLAAVQGPALDPAVVVLGAAANRRADLAKQAVATLEVSQEDSTGCWWPLAFVAEVDLGQELL